MFFFNIILNQKKNYIIVIVTRHITDHYCIVLHIIKSGQYLWLLNMLWRTEKKLWIEVRRICFTNVCPSAPLQHTLFYFKFSSLAVALWKMFFTIKLYWKIKKLKQGTHFIIFLSFLFFWAFKFHLEGKGQIFCGLISGFIRIN